MKKIFIKLILFVFSFIIVVIAGYFVFQKKAIYQFEETAFTEKQKKYQADIKDGFFEDLQNDFEEENNELILPVSLQKSELKTKEKKINEDNVASFIVKKNVSWGFKKLKEQREIDTIIIHSSYDALGNDPYSLEGLLKEYQQYGVAPHYLIDRKGIIYQLVSDQDVAYHAGISQTPDKRTNVNFFSLGIEVMNTKKDELTSQQYESLNNLLFYLKRKYKIKYVLGHNQIAPERKTDPWNFNWDKLKF